MVHPVAAELHLCYYVSTWEDRGGLALTDALQSAVVTPRGKHI